MKNLSRKLFAALISAVIICTAVLFSGCNNNKTDYSYIQPSLVGIWMLEGGPEYFMNENVGMACLKFYEFTSDNKLFLHYVYGTGDVTDDGSIYEIKDNYFVMGGARCLIDVQGDTMIMTNDNGEQRYSRISMEDTLKYSLSYNDAALAEEQNKFAAEYAATATTPAAE
ncbi:MAG: hypothetical protein ACI4KF_03475 [Huintestinicola sp.]